jgi:cytoplasmic tRNA 2-thiolation protein 2
MRDRTDEVRKAVERYDGFEFVSLRIEDAFDSRWWASVGGRDQIRERDLGVDLSGEGE